MGVIEKILGVIFGNGRNLVKDTAEVFRENAESGAQRGQQLQIAAMQSFVEEFYPEQRGWFDRAMDGVNRLPRPLMAMACLGMFSAAMVDPVWFSERMVGIALVPEPLWWLLGVVVSFYFGARHQAKGQDFQKSIAASMARVPWVVDQLEGLEHRRVPVAPRRGAVAVQSDENAALAEWKKQI